MSAFASRHLRFCIDEMLAEIDEQLKRNEFVRALMQLDQREARGERIEAVCGAALRKTLESKIAALPDSCLRRQVEAMQLSLVAGRQPSQDKDVVQAALAVAPSMRGVAAALPAPRSQISSGLTSLDLKRWQNVSLTVPLGMGYALPGRSGIVNLHAYRETGQGASATLHGDAKPAKARVRVPARMAPARVQI